MAEIRDTSNIVWSDYFIYDESSPSCLRWNVDIYSKSIKRAGIGWPATSRGTSGYYRVGLCGERYFVHRIIYELHFGSAAGLEIDHIDGNKLNNSIINLRAVPPSVNGRNKKMRKDNKTGFTGISFAKIMY